MRRSRQCFRANLQLPWIKLIPFIAKPGTGGDGPKVIEYKPFIESLTGTFVGKNSTVTLSDSIYRNRSEMETLFRLMDVDKSGQLSREEFHHACAILNECGGSGNQITNDEVDALLGAMDRNGDGMVSFNEFLEAVRVGVPKPGGTSAPVEPAAQPPDPATADS